jgi:hypothetical protein
MNISESGNKKKGQKKAESRVTFELTATSVSFIGVSPPEGYRLAFLTGSTRVYGFDLDGRNCTIYVPASDLSVTLNPTFRLYRYPFQLDALKGR